MVRKDDEDGHLHQAERLEKARLKEYIAAVQLTDQTKLIFLKGKAIPFSASVCGIHMSERQDLQKKIYIGEAFCE